MTGILKTSILGQLPNGEVWSVNPCWFGIVGDLPLTYDQLNTIATAINAVAVPTALRGNWSTGTAVTGVRLEHRELDGSLLAQLEQTRPAIAVGSSSTPLPMQAAAVTSLRTTSSGAHARGRLYWPATGALLDGTSLRLASAVVTNYISGVKTYLSGIATAIGATSPSPTLSVWSRALATTYPVNRILVGDIPDVQRRRRDAAIETYVTSSYP